MADALLSSVAALLLQTLEMDKALRQAGNMFVFCFTCTVSARYHVESLQLKIN
jgi:hypothetical protein